ncbi:hypothetical protein G7092_28205 [Mucilaginibacter sp. HC2]|uniref:hypothetical protein n=1 Tax=Mucilaginibacter inviolabilis TaxID=2714892 RepID=UPI00140E0C11|nr:hypothetical protein [Mucilaginibacter inviolabilis]NHA07716.1 hypothetical protein [Mucilaginibacter inviolabilis]
MQLPFRKTAPTRTYKGKEYSDYNHYKDHLEKDFEERCGYTNCHQFWFGGRRTFQIDHFKPKVKYPELLTKYSNLVYSCSYVNRAKSDDLNEYLDPCDTDYNLHFYRDQIGHIYPMNTSDTGKYMYKALKLYLKRYSIIWMLEALEEKMDILQGLVDQTGDEQAKNLFYVITTKYMAYKKYLKAVQ